MSLPAHVRAELEDLLADLIVEDLRKHPLTIYRLGPNEWDISELFDVTFVVVES